MYKENLKNYYNFLDTVLEKNNLKIHPEQIYKLDSPNPRPPKVVALRGQKKV